MGEKKFITPEYTTATEIKRVRTMFGLTQKEFAALIGSSKVTVERWERSEEPIRGQIVLLLRLLERHPEEMEMLKVPEKEYPLRLWYMHGGTVCTMIDVNEMTKQVKIKNYTNHAMFRAFGMTEAPDYDAYTEFLKSRCFPESRDKLKLVLKDLGLPFYEPLMIIEKTEGRMAEDDFWIRIER
ncbi:MAG: helix-turn-helix domain-containing protein [Lachnospiraceae bacterium]|nr:helix-turn-helix domain-containing protein [Lachnospiraceae bacterium]